MKDNVLHYIKIERSLLAGESKNCVIVELKKIKVWLPKSMVHPSEYTLFANIGINTSGDFTYNIVDTDNTISGKELIKAFTVFEIPSKPKKIVKSK